MDKSDFQGELEALIAGTRREFWSPDNLKAYGDERPAVKSSWASGGCKEVHSSGSGPPSESSGKVPILNVFSDQSADADVGSQSLQEMEESVVTPALSSRTESETPVTELDLLVQKYDRRLKQLHPGEKVTHLKKRMDIAKEKSGKYKCDACGKGFEQKRLLKRHVLIHGEERNFSCDICNKSFKQPTGLYSHMKVHDSKLSYDCHVCDYSSKRKRALNEHVKLHSDKAEFKCERCPKTFKQMGTLRQHRALTHTFDVPFRCENCGCGCKTKGRLKQHRMVHEDIREFKCEVCSKAFKSAFNLKRHSAIHSNDKRFPCANCSKAFHRKGNLKQHERTHTGERPFICCDCTKAFNHSSNLNQHRRVCPKLDFRVKDIPEEDFSPSNGNLIDTFASTIYADNDEGNSGFITMDKEGDDDAPPGAEDLDGTYTGRVIEVARSSLYI